MVIKGEPSEEAVLCTENKTYSIRSVVLSNSVLVVTPPAVDSSGEDAARTDDIVIRDQVHEVLELVPSLPKLQKLAGLLRGREYEERRDEDEMEIEDVDRPVRTSFIYVISL